LKGVAAFFVCMKNGQKHNNPQGDQHEPSDFYMEEGRVVFTEHFLRKRGYCCQSGCRHCPYGFKKPDAPKRP
jgi:hypothetical protein